MSKCAICEQKNVDGAIDQFGQFICVDCWAFGEAKACGSIAVKSSPVPGYDYSGIDDRKVLEAYNRGIK